MDIGTPERYLEATWDILEGRVRDGGRADRSRDAASTRRAVVDRGCLVGPRAVSRPAAGSRPERRSGARSCSSGCEVGDGGGVIDSILAPGVRWRPAPGSRARCSARVKGYSGDRRPMLDDILAMPDHLRDAPLAGRVGPASRRAGRGRARLRHGRLGDRRATSPPRRSAIAPPGRWQTVRGYGLPSWATPGWSVLCCSYSGDTEETIACFDAAEALGARRIVASTGGVLAEQARAAGVPVVGLPGTLQPRAAVAYMFVVAAEAAALAGAAPRIDTEIERRRRSPRIRPRRPAGTGRRDRRAARGLGACGLRSRSHRPCGAALEDPGEREREAAGLLHRAARGRPQ